MRYCQHANKREKNEELTQNLASNLRNDNHNFVTGQFVSSLLSTWFSDDICSILLLGDSTELLRCGNRRLWLQLPVWLVYVLHLLVVVELLCILLFWFASLEGAGIDIIILPLLLDICMEDIALPFEIVVIWNASHDNDDINIHIISTNDIDMYCSRQCCLHLILFLDKDIYVVDIVVDSLILKLKILL